jgi:hypothetical protein
MTTLISKTSHIINVYQLEFIVIRKKDGEKIATFRCGRKTAQRKKIEIEENHGECDLIERLV